MLEIAVFLNVVEVLLHTFPDLLQPRPGHRRRGVDLGPPPRFGHGEKPQGSLKLGLRQFGLVYVLSVGLGDDHQVGHLHDAALDALQFVSRTGNLQQHEKVHHRVHGGFRLPDAHRFDEDDVESCGFAQHDRLACLPGHSAERPRRRRGPHEDRRVVADALHAGFVAENRAAAALRRGVYGQHRQLVAQPRDHVADGLDEGRFAGSRDARDADADRFPGMREARLDDLLRLRIVVGVRRFDERDGLREGGDVACENALDILPGGERALLAALEVRAYYRLFFNALRNVEGCVVVRVCVLFFVMVYLGE